MMPLKGVSFQIIWHYAQKLCRQTKKLYVLHLCYYFASKTIRNLLATGDWPAGMNENILIKFYHMFKGYHYRVPSSIICSKVIITDYRGQFCGYEFHSSLLTSYLLDLPLLGCPVILLFLLFLQNTYFFILLCHAQFQNAANCCESVHIACVIINVNNYGKNNLGHHMISRY